MESLMNKINGSRNGLPIHMEDDDARIVASEFVAPGTVVSNEALAIFKYVVHIGLISIICLLGITGNSIALAVFFRQGFKDTINISLTAIAVWDLIKCVCGLLDRIPGVVEPFSPAMHQTLYIVTGVSAGYISTICTYVSSVLAGYISVERCLCVSLPFTVKQFITQKLVITMMVTLSFLTFGSCCVIFPIHEIFLFYDPKYNMTVMDGKISANFFKFPFLYRMFNVVGFMWPALSFSVQLFCTSIIAYRLHKSREFRESNNPKHMSTREQQVTKMLLVIIVCYIVMLFPRLTMNVAKLVITGFLAGFQYSNLFHVCMWTQFVFDFINACLNPIVYYSMSSRFKATLLQMFPLTKK